MYPNKHFVNSSVEWQSNPAVRIVTISAAMREREMRDTEGEDSHHLSYETCWILFSGNKWDSNPEDHKIPSVTERGPFSIQSQTKEKVFCLNCSVPQYHSFHPTTFSQGHPIPCGKMPR